MAIRTEHNLQPTRATDEPVLPSPHVFGEAVVAQLFGRSRPDTAEVYSVDPIPMTSLKRLFPSLDGAAVVVERSRIFVLNCDYWATLPAPSPISSLRADQPVIRELAVVGDLDDLGSLRALHIAKTYPWEAIGFDIEDMRTRAFEFAAREIDAADVAAMKLGYASAAALVMEPGT